MSSRKKAKTAASRRKAALLNNEVKDKKGFASLHRFKTLFLLLSLTGIGIFYISTLRAGHDFSGDNCMYVMHAQSLISGNPYDQTNFIFNPNATIFPPTYPPGLSFLLIPIVIFNPLNWEWMKIELILLFVAALMILYRAADRSMNAYYAIGVVLIVGFSSYFLELKDYVLSEIPFIFFAYLSFELGSVAENKKSLKQTIFFPVLTGVCAYLSYSCRSVGLLVIGALVLYRFLKYRSEYKFLFLMCGTFAALYVLQNLFLHADAGHLAHKAADFNPEMIKINLTHNYPLFFSWIWENNFFPKSGMVLTLIGTVVSALGTASRFLSKKFNAWDCFYLIYLGAFLAVRLNDTAPQGRYLIPVIPIYLWHFIEGINVLNKKISTKVGVCIMVMSVLVLVTGNLEKISALKKNGWDYSISEPKAMEMYEFIKNNTAPSEIIASHYPRVLALYTNRKCAHYLMAYLKGDASAITRFKYFRKLGVKYYALKQDLSPGYLYQHELKKVFDNGKYYVYQL